MKMLGLDVRYGFRGLVRQPALTFAAVASLALGIGANTTIFTLVHALLLRPLPVAEPSRLVGVFTTDPASNVPILGQYLQVSWPNTEDLRRDASRFSGIAAYTFPFGVAFSTADQPEQAAAELVSGNYFDVLGVSLSLGRAFLPSDDRVDGEAPVVVISDRFFRRRFASDSGVVGRTVRINGHVFAIVGVAPRGFEGANAIFGPDLWIPIRMHAAVLPSEFRDWLDSRRSLFVSVAGRLRPGVTLAEAEDEVQRLGTQLAREHPRDNARRGLTTRPLSQSTILPGIRDLFVLGGSVLMIVVALVLLVACANVANLLLARATARRGEMALRASLGATRLRLLRQMLVESVLLACAGGAGGLLLGAAGRNWLRAMRPPGLIGQNFAELTLDGPVLSYTAAVSAATVLVFGIVPAVRATRTDVSTLLREQGRGSGGRRGQRVALSLVGVQAAISLVALVTAGMLIASLRAAQQIEPGFDIRRLAVLQVSPGQAAHDRARGDAFYRAVKEQVSHLAPISSAAWTQLIPLYGNGTMRTVLARESGEDAARGVMAVASVVDEGFFQTAGIAIVDGRGLSSDDRADNRPVVVVKRRTRRPAVAGCLTRRATSPVRDRCAAVRDRRRCAGEPLCDAR
jgi:predicted permease